MEIRRCRTEEIEKTGAFYDSVVLWLTEHVNYPKWVYGIYPSTDFVKEMTEDESQYVCLKDGRLCGAFVLNEDPQGKYQKGSWETYVPDGSYLVMHAVAVDQEMAGQGIGTEIIRFCEEKAKAGGYKALRIDVVPENTPAKEFYLKNGFRYAGDCDLERGIDGIPVFSLYEMNM